MSCFVLHFSFRSICCYKMNKFQTFAMEYWPSLILTMLLIFLYLRYKKRSDVKLPSVNFYLFIISFLWNRWKKQLDVLPLQCRAFLRVNAACKTYEKEGMFLLNLGFRKVTCVFNAHIIKILINHSAAQEKSWDYGAMECIGGSGLLLASREKARHRRRLLAPAFQGKILEDFIDVFNEMSVYLVNNIAAHAKEPWIEIDKFSKKCTLDVICQTAMGVQIAGNKDAADFMENIDNCMKVIVHRICCPWTRNDFIYQFFPYGRKLWKLYWRIKKFIDKVIAESKEAVLLQIAKEKNIANPDIKKEEKICKQRRNFMNILLQVHMADPSFTLDDLREEVVTFIVGGYDTLSVGIDHTLLMLGLYPDIQEKAILEIDSIFGDDFKRLASFDDIKKMEYLDCVIKEALRLYPPGPFIAREIQEDICIGKYKLPAGTGVLFNIFMLHRDSEFFPDPENFDPERFSPEKVQQRNPYAYMPFSAGARVCIGQKFAMIEMKCVISSILRSFRIQTLDPRDQLTFSFNIMLKNIKPLRLKFIPRCAS